MYGQMIVGLWIYIGSQGIVQGIYEIFVEVGCQYYDGNFKGCWVFIVGFGGMGGVQLLVVILVGVCLLNIECQQSCIDFCLCSCYVDEQVKDLDDVLVWIQCYIVEGKVIFIVLLGNVVEIFLELVCCGVCLDMVIDQISVYDLFNGYLLVGWSWEEYCDCVQIDLVVVVKVVKQFMVVYVWVMLVFQQQGVLIFDYGNNICQMVKEEGVVNVFDFFGFVLVYICLLFCCGIGLFCWVVLLGDLQDIYKIDVKVK